MQFLWHHRIAPSKLQVYTGQSLRPLQLTRAEEGQSGLLSFDYVLTGPGGSASKVGLLTLPDAFTEPGKVVLGASFKPFGSSGPAQRISLELEVTAPPRLLTPFQISRDRDGIRLVAPPLSSSSGRFYLRSPDGTRQAPLDATLTVFALPATLELHHAGSPAPIQTIQII